jgi:hypothetical protein
VKCDVVTWSDNVCFVVICVPFSFIVMYVVSLFSMLSYCLVGWYYLSCVCSVLLLFILSVLSYCVVFVLSFFFLCVVFVFLYLYTEHCHRVETQLQLINLNHYQSKAKLLETFS